MKPLQRAIVMCGALMVAAAHPTCGAEPQQPTGGKEKTVTALRITSPAFHDSQKIPPRCTADGLDVSPQLSIEGVPKGTQSLSLIVDDPDAPNGTWVHWVLWNIPPSTTMIEEGTEPDGSMSGRNSWGQTGYGGPSPPSGTHRYFFKLYALDTELDLPPTADKAELEQAMVGHILGEAQLMGTYTRN